MRERGILMSGPMVRAILDGRKKQARRVVQPQPFPSWVPYQMQFKKRHGDRGGYWLWPNCGNEILAECPYGVAGQTLWVKETWCDPTGGGRAEDIAYRADDPGAHRLCAAQRCLAKDFPQSRWRPSTNMPRWASRITLEVEEVRVERVQDISDEEIEAEGIEAVLAPSHPKVAPGFRIPGQLTVYESPVAAFRALWDSIHGAGAWERNDWCWVVTFRPLEVRNAG